MITKQLQNELKNFFQLSKRERVSLLHQKGLLLDSDVEKERRVNLFYLNGFFVEEILNKITSEIEEIIPFKSGYKLDYYLHNLHQRENDEEMLDVG